MAEGMGIASCAGHSDNKKDPVALCLEQEANARLIAAAPDLLEACEKLISSSEFMRDEYSDMNDAVQDALSVIARAKGEKWIPA
jgi:hypothetical protein